MIYLDNGATTQPFPEVVAACADAMQEDYYNPSALYAPAMRGAAHLQNAQRQLLASLGKGPSWHSLLTSGGTESNATAIIGRALRLQGKRGRFLFSAAEHPSVSEAMRVCETMGHSLCMLPVDAQGRVDQAAYQDALREDVQFVSIQQVNSETGAIQPIDDMARMAHEAHPRALFHTDAVQGFLRLPPPSDDVDMISVSAHKVHGPRGVGALVYKGAAQLSPLIPGGGQQNGLRSGTQDVPGAAGFAAAIAQYARFRAAVERMAQLKQLLGEGIMAALPDVQLNGPPMASGAPHILSLSFPLRAEVLLHALEGEGILVATGSACSSRSKKPSAVLRAMGLSTERIEGTLRFSLSPLTTPEDIATTIQAVARLVPLYSRYTRR